MAKAKKEGAYGGEARVLADIHGVAKADNLLVAPIEIIKALTDIGQVDPHPDAVDYAKASGATVVTIEG